LRGAREAVIGLGRFNGGDGRDRGCREIIVRIVEQPIGDFNRGRTVHYAERCHGGDADVRRRIASRQRGEPNGGTGRAGVRGQ
jgi:hypothetical protein